MKGTRGIVALLTCMTCASAAAAQTSQEYSRVQEVEQQRVRKAEAKAEAQARATQQKRAARGARPVQPGGQETTETVSRTVRLERGGTFDLWNSTSGDVTITGTGGREARIEAIKVVRALSPQRARAQLDALRVDIAERGGNVEVRTFQPRSPSQGIVRYVVTLPENTSLILRTASGNLHVQNMAGDEITANTLSGNVVARDLRSRVVELHTVLGSMNLQDIAAQRAFLQSMAGKVEYAGRFLRAGRYQFQTHGGDITVTPSGGPGFDLEATTFRGELRNDFDLKRMLEPPAFRRGPVQKTLRGTVGDAGAMLTVTSFSGNIVIVKP